VRGSQIVPPVVRPVQPGDLESILALDRVTPQAPHWSTEEYQRIVSGKQPEGPERIMLVAEQSGELSGFVVLLLVADTAEIESIVVAEAWRRRGTGASLMEVAMQHSRDHQIARLILEVRDNNQAAIAFYTRCGFKIEGRRPGYYSHPVEDALLMGQDL
jgi:ribosomal-protein-alanine N-acetyltransferase